MSDHQLLYLSRADVETIGVTMREIIDALAVAFREHGEGHVEMPPKPGVHSPPRCVHPRHAGLHSGACAPSA